MLPTMIQMGICESSGLETVKVICQERVGHEPSAPAPPHPAPMGVPEGRDMLRIYARLVTTCPCQLSLLPWGGGMAVGGGAPCGHGPQAPFSGTRQRSCPRRAGCSQLPGSRG